MNKYVEEYIAKRKSELKKTKIDKLEKLGIGERVYSDNSLRTDEFPFFDEEKQKAYKCVLNEFSEEDYDEVMKYFPPKNNTKIWFAIYLIWVCIHFVLLFWGTEYWEPGIEDFFDINYGVWPFSGEELRNDYDVSEFIVYSVIPLTIYWIIYLLKGSKNKKQ